MSAFHQIPERRLSQYREVSMRAKGLVGKEEVFSAQFLHYSGEYCLGKEFIVTGSLESLAYQKPSISNFRYLIKVDSETNQLIRLAVKIGPKNVVLVVNGHSLMAQDSPIGIIALMQSLVTYGLEQWVIQIFNLQDEFMQEWLLRIRTAFPFITLGISLAAVDPQTELMATSLKLDFLLIGKAIQSEVTQ